MDTLSSLLCISAYKLTVLCFLEDAQSLFLVGSALVRLLFLLMSDAFVLLQVSAISKERERERGNKTNVREKIAIRDRFYKPTKLTMYETRKLEYPKS